MENLEQPYKKTKNDSLNLETIFKFCPDGIVCKDTDLRYVVANESYIETFSSNDFDSIIGRKNNPYISNNIMKLIQDADREVKQSRSSINYVLTLENNIMLNITTFPIVHKNIFSGLISIIKDITQEEAIKENFVNKHFEHIDAERKLQSQRETFVASLGHDLKNPTIAQIRGLELILKGEFGEINEDQRELLEMVLESCKYMNGMLATLLVTYRNTDGVIELHKSEFSFEELVKECISEMTYVAKEKGVSFNLNESLDGDLISADKVQIKRVIMNLLSNGIKYAYRDTELKLRIYSEQDLFCFEFENNSPYIPEDKQNAIFAQYVSYADTHKEIGIGLGLFASRKIIEAHNGQIYVESFLDERNKFGFKIPVKNEA